jgi:CDP-4-dehydro-6-deoxyglucose reductase, E3
MSFNITVQPSGRAFTATSDETLLAAGLRQGIGLPYGCKDGACGSCKCKKISGDVTHGTHQEKALSAEEAANGFVLTCCATAHSDVVLESRQVVEEGAFPIKKMPVRVVSLHKASHDVMIVKLQLPATDPMKFHAGQYVDFLLRDGDRRSYSMANAPHTLVEGKKKKSNASKAHKAASSCVKTLTSLWSSWLRALALRRSKPSWSTCNTKASHAP